MKRLRLILWIAVALAALAGVAILILHKPGPGSSTVRTQALSTLGGPFTLTAADGRPFSSSQLDGKPYAIFFGFTHCPDVCPTTLARMVRLRQQLGAGDNSFAIVLVTVDPERDKPADMLNYVRLFNSPVIGLTGSPSQIEQVKKQFGIFSKKVPTDGGGYSVDHSATTLLFDRAGRFQATIAPEEADSNALEKLKRLTSNS